MTKRINLVGLEFDEIKNNLKEFLRSQSQFSDYDFEGSNMSILLDMLAYNTHYNALYTNLALNEAFLDSASRRDSVVSLAKSLGYTPRSRRAARTLADFNIVGVPAEATGNLPPFITLAKGTTFQGIKDNIRYSFITPDAYTVNVNSVNQYEFRNIPLLEGEIIVNRIEYNEQNMFRIGNRNIDTSTLIVRIQDTANSTSFTVFNLATDFASLNGESNVYFLREIDGFYEISFGDGIVGKRLDVGSIINLEYVVCSADAPNGIRLISYVGGPLLGGSIQNLTIQDVISGGREKEDIEQIRFNAPNFYASQNRAVSALDYEALLLSKVPAIEEVSVWGGENNFPPMYGKVFISAKKASGRNFTFTEQQLIIDQVIEKHKVVSVIPEFVEPVFIEVDLSVFVYYDTTLTVLGADDIKSTVVDNLLSYDKQELRKFNRVMRGSAINRVVEGSDPSILSCVQRLKISRPITVIFSKQTTYNANIGNPLAKGTIKSNGFYLQGFDEVCYFDDDSNGTIKLFYLLNGERIDIRNAGTINYDLGQIQINNLIITRLVENELKVTATPASPDVASVFNQIVLFNLDNLSVSMIADASSKGRILSGNKFQFTKNIL